MPRMMPRMVDPTIVPTITMTASTAPMPAAHAKPVRNALAPKSKTSRIAQSKTVLALLFPSDMFLPITN